jgi:signal transduction histidine kinase
MEINMHSEIIAKFPLPFAIWKKEFGDKYVCIFTNEKIENLKIGDTLSDFSKDKMYVARYNDINDTDEITIKNNGHIIYLIRINQDIFYELHENISTDNYHMLSVISHKIRGPLTNIIGILTLMDDTKNSKIQRKYLNLIKKSSLEVVMLANDIVDLMNLSQNRIRLNLSPTNIRNCVNDCVDMAKPNIGKKNINIKMKISKKVPELLVIDSDRMQQILLGFITNAIKYTDSGIVSIIVCLYEKPDPNNPFHYIQTTVPKYNLLFKIKDTGMGIDDEKAEIMKKQLMIKDTDKLISYKTCGFTLLISRHLIDMMRGNIWFHTHLDMGTVFYFNIIADALDF